MSKAPEWWESYFDHLYLTEHGHMFDPGAERRFVSRLLGALGLPQGSEILDLPCGQGRYVGLLAEAGMRVTGVDYSDTLLDIARNRNAGSGSRFHRHDMRRLPRSWSGRYDAVLNVFSSFGFFADQADDRRAVAEFARVLRRGGRLIWHGANRDYVAARFPARDWWRAADGTTVLQEREFDPITGVLTVNTTWVNDSGSVNRSYRLRLYNPTQLVELFLAEGLIVVGCEDGDRDVPLGRRSATMLLVAQRE